MALPQMNLPAIQASTQTANEIKSLFSPRLQELLSSKSLFAVKQSGTVALLVHFVKEKDRQTLEMDEAYYLLHQEIPRSAELQRAVGKVMFNSNELQVTVYPNFVVHLASGDFQY